MFDTDADMTELFNDIDQHLLDNDDSKLVTGNEVETLILSLASARGEEGFTEEECVAIVRWAEAARLDSIMLDFVLNGTVQINWVDDQPMFSLTEAGKARNREARG